MKGEWGTFVSTVNILRPTHYSKVVFDNVIAPLVCNKSTIAGVTSSIPTEQATLLLIARPESKPKTKPCCVCTCFSMMSFVFAPAAKSKPNLQNVLTPMTLSMTPYTVAPQITWCHMSADLFFGYVLVYVLNQRFQGILPR